MEEVLKHWIIISPSLTEATTFFSDSSRSVYVLFKILQHFFVFFEIVKRNFKNFRVPLFMVVNIFNISALYRYFIGAIRGSQMVFKDFLKNCLAVFEIL